MEGGALFRLLACQNHQIVTFYDVHDEKRSGRCEAVRPQALLELDAGPAVRFYWIFGGWLAHHATELTMAYVDPRPPQPRLIMHVSLSSLVG